MLQDLDHRLDRSTDVSPPDSDEDSSESINYLEHCQQPSNDYIIIIIIIIIKIQPVTYYINDIISPTTWTLSS